MKKVWKLFLILTALVVPVISYAQDDISISTGIVGNGRYLGAKTTDGQTTVPVLGVDSSGNTQVNALSGKTVVLSAAKTPVLSASTSGLTVPTGGITLSTAGSYLNPGIYVPTAVATPVTGTNLCPPGICAVPTNAANNAVFVGAATPVAGTQFFIKNTNGTNLVRAKAAGGATINGATAGGWIGLAAGTSMHCMYYTVGDLTCDTYSTAGGTTAALPTPAGP